MSGPLYVRSDPCRAPRSTLLPFLLLIVVGSVSPSKRTRSAIGPFHPLWGVEGGEINFVMSTGHDHAPVTLSQNGQDKQRMFVALHDP